MEKVTQADLSYALGKPPCITINTYSLTLFLLTCTFRCVTHEQCFPYVMVSYVSLSTCTKYFTVLVYTIQG